MMPRVFLPEPLRAADGLAPVLDVPGATLGQVLAAVGEQWPEVGEKILLSPERLALGVVVYVGDVDARRRGGLSAHLSPVDEVYVVVPLFVGR
jgi:hypothetical protein